MDAAKLCLNREWVWENERPHTRVREIETEKLAKQMIFNSWRRFINGSESEQKKKIHNNIKQPESRERKKKTQVEKSEKQR